MSVTHDFNCGLHGEFTARVESGVTPMCPYGCSSEFVKLVFLTPPSIGTQRVRNASRMIKEALDAQGLTDCDISKSTPGSSPADKNWKRNSKNPIKAEVWSGDKLGGLVQSFPKDNAIRDFGLGRSHGGGATFTKVKE